MKKAVFHPLTMLLMAAMLMTTVGCGRPSSGPAAVTEQSDLMRYLQDHPELSHAKESAMDDTY
tara:strand:+ start:63311 stop:63499 length:189 start_codon:yes stop_codon:yes gene_type:complete